MIYLCNIYDVCLMYFKIKTGFIPLMKNFLDASDVLEDSRV